LAEIDALKLLLQWIADLFKAKLEKKDKEE
jgi:hypothetical protein